MPLSQATVTRITAAIAAVYLLILFAHPAAGPSQGWPGTQGEITRAVDYAAIWTGGRFALEGRPLDAYDWDLVDNATRALAGQPSAEKLPFPYPPTFMALAAALATLPYGLSMMMWAAATWAAYAAAALRIIGTWRGAIWMSASVAVLYSAMIGQNGALSAALLGLGLALVPKRPVLAGISIGLLSYKPHLGLLIPLALAAGGHWRVFVSAAATAVMMALASLVCFGPEVWGAFIAHTGKMASHYASAPSPWKLQSLFGLLRTSGLATEYALALHAVAASVAAFLVAMLWRGPAPYALKAAALAACSLLVSPYVFIYDLAVLMVAQAFLVRHALDHGIDERELDGIVLANALVALAPAIGFPAGVLATLLLALLVARRNPRIDRDLVWHPRTTGVA
jgi:hypothetical protein